MNPRIIIPELWASNPLEPIHYQRHSLFTAYGNVCLLQQVGSNRDSGTAHFLSKQGIKTLKGCSNIAWSAHVLAQNLLLALLLLLTCGFKLSHEFSLQKWKSLDLFVVMMWVCTLLKAESEKKDSLLCKYSIFLSLFLCLKNCFNTISSCYQHVTNMTRWCYNSFLDIRKTKEDRVFTQ